MREKGGQRRQEVKDEEQGKRVGGGGGVRREGEHRGRRTYLLLRAGRKITAQPHHPPTPFTVITAQITCRNDIFCVSGSCRALH